jgi:hypothetical protein
LGGHLLGRQGLQYSLRLADPIRVKRIDQMVQLRAIGIHN